MLCCSCHVSTLSQQERRGSLLQASMEAGKSVGDENRTPQHGSCHPSQPGLHHCHCRCHRCCLLPCHLRHQPPAAPPQTLRSLSPWPSAAAAQWPCLLMLGLLSGSLRPWQLLCLVPTPRCQHLNPHLHSSSLPPLKQYLSRQCLQRCAHVKQRGASVPCASAGMSSQRRLRRPHTSSTGFSALGGLPLHTTKCA